MAEENKQKSDLQQALDLDAEIENWREEVTSRIIALHDQIDEAEEANNQKLAEQLNEKLDVWRSVKQAGYSRAEESEQGREVLDYVRKRKEEVDEIVASHLKQKAQKNNSL